MAALCLGLVRFIPNEYSDIVSCPTLFPRSFSAAIESGKNLGCTWLCSVSGNSDTRVRVKSVLLSDGHAVFGRVEC